MGLSTDVNLPRSHSACFPQKCVVCGQAEPGGTVSVFSGVIGWWTWVFWTWGGVFTVCAPACPTCAWSLHLRRVIGLVVTIGIVMLFLFYVWPLVGHQVPRFLKKWGMMIGAILCLLPQIAFEVFFPPAFDVTAFADSVDYEFRNEDAAYEFAALNQDADWVKVEMHLRNR